MRRKIVGLGVFLVVCGISYGKSFTLEDILERAKSSNPQVKIQRLNTQVTKKEKDKALKNYILPPITIEDSSEWDDIKKYGLGIKSVDLQINVFEGGKSIHGYKTLKSKLAIAENNEVLTEIKAQEEAVATYFTILNAQKQKEITDTAIKLMEKQRSRIWDLYTNGKFVPKSEYLKIEANIESNKVLNMKNEQEETNTMGILARILDYPLNSQIELEDFDPEAYLQIKAHVRDGNKKPVEATLLGKNEKHNLDIAEYNVKIAKAELYPTIYTKYEHNFTERDSNGDLRDVNEDRFELGFKWVFEWGGTLDNVKSKEFAYEQARIKYDDQIKGITLEMRNHLTRVKSLYGQSFVMKKRAELLKENMEIDNMRYENELLSTFDYLNSVNNYRSAQEDYYKSQRDLVLAVIQYENLYK